MDIIVSKAPTILTSETTFSNDLLTVDAFSKITKLYGTDIITTEEVMDELNFSSIDLENGRIWLVGFRKKFIRCRYTMYLHGFPGRMPNPRCLFEFSRSGTSGN